MANKKIWLGILVTVLVFGMTVVGCGDGSTDDNGGNKGGTFVLTDIPATYNGKYAHFEAENSSVYIVGCQSINLSTDKITLVQISNGKASFPMWIFNDNGTISKYSGNDTFTQNDVAGIGIYNTATLNDDNEEIAGIYFSTVAFTNGNATKSVNDGFIITD
jgi:hypothetical protein